MIKEQLYLYDTTLRDGAQTPGIDFSVQEKQHIMAVLDELGLDYIEGGYPGANPTDTALFEAENNTQATFCAFGMTKRAGRSVDNDPGLQALLQANSDAVCFVAKSWDFHVKLALGCTNQENLEGIAQSVKATIDAGKEALVDCEHFFDGYKANREYALACAKTAYQAGARWVVLCDTNGGTLPHEIEAVVADTASVVPGDFLGIHTHDDTGQAVANSLAAIRAGVRHVQGTLNGIGERCGNANLISLIPTLLLKKEFAEKFELSISREKLQTLTQISRSFDEMLNRAPERQSPYVGASAFATKAGIHASAILKSPETYEHINPTDVGNVRAVLVSDQAGKSNLLAELRRMGLEVENSDSRVNELLRIIKEREADGFAYDSADASLELLSRRHLNKLPFFFDVVSYKVIVERRFDATGKKVTAAEAIVKVAVDGEIRMSVGEGNGPVNALDAALRKDLGRYQEVISDLQLLDYKVRILNGGTSATTRVLIESGDAEANRWFTVGVSPNIVDASFQALVDSINFKLLKSGVAEAAQ
jgi:2-isopropylmalate synthase